MPIASDDFNRAAIGATWTFQTAETFTVVSNELRVPATGNPGGAWINTLAPCGPWQFSRFAVGTVLDNTLDQGAGPACCMADAADTSYAVLLNTAATGRFQLVRRNGAAQSVLKNYIVVAPATGNTVWLVKRPDYHLYVYLGDPVPANEIISFDDSANANRLETGRVGAFGLITTSVATLDNFEGGDWPYRVTQPPNLPVIGRPVAGT